MTTGTMKLVRWVAKGVALLGLSGALVVGADRLVGSLRRDVHAVLARPAAAAPVPAPVKVEPGVRVARVERR